MRVAPDATVRRHAEGRLLVGGSPLRLVRLSRAGAELLGRWLDGAPIGDDPAARTLARRLLDAGVIHPVGGGRVHTTADVTLVIPVRDNPAGVQRLLARTRSLRHHLVVDDGSRPPATAAHLRHDTPQGPAAARNTGWREARTDLIAFVDSDVEPETGWLDALVPLFDDPAVAAVAPRVRATTDTPVPRTTALLSHYEATRCALDMGATQGVVRPLSRIGYVPSAALLVRRSALRAVGGFDERLRFGEDVDLVWRLADAGFLIRYHPGAVVRHRPRRTLRAWLTQRFDYGTSAAALARRHPGRLACASVKPWSAVIWALLVTGRPLPAGIAAVTTTAVAQHRLRRHGLPPAVACSIAGRGHLLGGRALADAVRRTWWPLALLTRTGRRAVLVALLPLAVEAVAGRRPPSWWLLRLAEDLAYSAGVWAGCLRARTLAPLLPDLAARPGASTAPEKRARPSTS
ncbi:mycofactocin biosynthesis glycosyltransferase MftF [Nocardia sp. CA2R105]|nr:mycofactocin biosynthesis glycosyltransferase MftF [Nocardia coffeae]